MFLCITMIYISRSTDPATLLSRCETNRTIGKNPILIEIDCMKYPTLLLICVTFVCCRPQANYFEDAICIEHVSTIDPLVGLREDQTVVVRDGKIYKLAASADLPLSDKNKIVDGTGKYLIPGLWDTHVHFAYMEELAPRMFDLFLLYGVTSVRDTGGKLEFVLPYRDQAKRDPTHAPRVMIAGPLLDGMPNVYDGIDPGHPPLSSGLRDVGDLEKKVRQLDSAGVDFLKAYEMLTPDQFKRLIRMAGERGLKVTGHVPLSMDVISASNAGLNSMEHLRNVEISCASNWQELWDQRREMLKNANRLSGGDLRSSIHAAQREVAVGNFDPNRAAEVIQALKKNDTWQIPTLALNTLRGEQFFRNTWWEESLQYLPDSTAARWRALTNQIMNGEVPPFQKEYAVWMLNMVGKMREASIPFMAGTDTPIGFQTPGVSLHNELAMMVKGGLTPLEAIRSATLNPARYFRMDSELGLIRENMWADLLLLNANPLDNIENTRQIYAVFRQGAYYDRAELDKLRLRLDRD